MFLLLLPWIDASPEDLSAWIRRLGSDCIVERERATRHLGLLGAPALGPLARAMEDPDPEVSGRARRARARLHASLPGEELDLRDVDLDTLTRAVQARTGRQLLWTEDLGLARRRVRIVSDFYLGTRPDLLFEAYRVSIQFCDVTAIAHGDGTSLRLRPFPRSNFSILTEPRGFETRILALRADPIPEMNDPLMSMATFPQCILGAESGRIVILTDYPDEVDRMEGWVRACDERALRR